jgi:hypothetical protein
MTPDDDSPKLDMHPNPLIVLLLMHERISTARFAEEDDEAPYIIARINEQLGIQRDGLPDWLGDYMIEYETGPPITDLRAYAPEKYPQNVYQACQNEPIKLGTQLQPSAANWVGTAGAPVTWLDTAKRRHWGILSNWHVMVVTPGELGRPQHQPFATQPACARLYDAEMPSKTKANLIDAAIADALIDGYHTIDREIIEIGRLATGFASAKPGDAAEKCGRTTGHTRAKCTATGVAARVQYGDFTALFQDQDQYEPDDGQFSAAGDSGSLIVTGSPPKATSLLFAGGGNVTLGCPVRHVAPRFNLDFGF